MNHDQITKETKLHILSLIHCQTAKGKQRQEKNNFHKLAYVISLVNQQLHTELFIVKILSFYQKRDPFPTPS